MSSIVLGARVLGAPTNVSATVDRVTSNVSVSWTAPTNNGGTPITKYIITSSPGNITSTANQSTSGSVLIPISNFVVGSTYTFTVKAYNIIGPGPTSSPSNSVAPTTVPDAPTIGTVTKSGTTASVPFTPGDTGGLSVTYTATSSPGGITATGTSPISVSGLSGSTTYTFTVTAANSLGSSTSSASNSITIPAPPGSIVYAGGTFTWIAPAGVTSVSVVAVGGGGGQGCTANGYDSYFINKCTIYGGGGKGGSLSVCNGGSGNGGAGGTYGGSGSYGGGNGGAGGFTGNGITTAGGGGGAGGYSGNGGAGSSSGAGSSGSGGGGGGGGSAYGGGVRGGGGGGGVNLFGQCTSGAGGASTCCNNGGYGGSGGGRGNNTYHGGDTMNSTAITVCSVSYNSYYGGSFGGGAGSCYGRKAGGGGGGLGWKNNISVTPGSSYTVYAPNFGNGGSSGAVRIVWPGNTRQFPSTCVGTP